MRPIDLQHHLGAVHREVATTTYDGRPARRLTLERSYDAAPDDVWPALTTPERLARWFEPTSGDLRVGGRYRLASSGVTGEVLACTAPEHLAVTWEYDGDRSRVDVTLRPSDAGTLLRIDHVATVDPAYWGEFGAGAGGLGWETSVIGLAAHLRDPSSPPADELPGLDALLEGAATGWAEAAIADGDDPAEARAACARAAAAYREG